MKTYMALDGLRWSRDSGSVHCNMPRSAVFGRSGGGVIRVARVIVIDPVVNRVGMSVGVVAASLVAILAKGNVVVCAQR